MRLRKLGSSDLEVSEISWARGSHTPVASRPSSHGPAPTPRSMRESTSSTPRTSTGRVLPSQRGVRFSPAAPATPTCWPPRCGERCPTPTGVFPASRSPNRSTPRCAACAPTTSTCIRLTGSTQTCRSRTRSKRCRRWSRRVRPATWDSASGHLNRSALALTSVARTYSCRLNPSTRCSGKRQRPRCSPCALPTTSPTSCGLRWRRAS